MTVEEWLRGAKKRPWTFLGMSTASWQHVPVVPIYTEWITPTQDALIPGDDGGRSYSGDIYPHVVWIDFVYYLDDGHHRIAKNIELLIPIVAVRLFKIPNASGA